MRLYLDMCCFKRPFDDQRDERIRREAEAVAVLVARAERGDFDLVRSPALLVEHDRNPREDRRIAAALWIDGAAVDVPLSPAVEARAREFNELGFAPMDALHVAFAEASGAARFVTCNDRLVFLGARHREQLKLPIVNPVDVVPTEE
jgi:predicted nucleic acid-binding protein